MTPERHGLCETHCGVKAADSGFVSDSLLVLRSWPPALIPSPDRPQPQSAHPTAAVGLGRGFHAFPFHGTPHRSLLRDPLPGAAYLSRSPWASAKQLASGLWPLAHPHPHGPPR